MLVSILLLFLFLLIAVLPLLLSFHLVWISDHLYQDHHIRVRFLQKTFLVVTLHHTLLKGFSFVIPFFQVNLHKVLEYLQSLFLARYFLLVQLLRREDTLLAF